MLPSKLSRAGLSKPTVGKLRLSDENFVALVLNRYVTQKIKIILYKYVFSFVKLLHLSMYFIRVTKQVYIFIALSTKVIPTEMPNCSISN